MSTLATVIVGLGAAFNVAFNELTLQLSNHMVQIGSRTCFSPPSAPQIYYTTAKNSSSITNRRWYLTLHLNFHCALRAGWPWGVSWVATIRTCRILVQGIAGYMSHH